MNNTVRNILAVIVGLVLGGIVNMTIIASVVQLFRRLPEPI